MFLSSPTSGKREKERKREPLDIQNKQFPPSFISFYSSFSPFFLSPPSLSLESNPSSNDIVYGERREISMVRLLEDNDHRKRYLKKKARIYKCSNIFSSIDPPFYCPVCLNSNTA